MSFGDKLKAAADESAAKLCKIGALLSSDKLNTADKKNLVLVLDTPPDNPTRIPNTVLGRILREEGHDISNSAVDRHRRLDCACGRIAR